MKARTARYFTKKTARGWGLASLPILLNLVREIVGTASDIDFVASILRDKSVDWVVWALAIVGVLWVAWIGHNQPYRERTGIVYDRGSRGTIRSAKIKNQDQGIVIRDSDVDIDESDIR